MTNCTLCKDDIKPEEGQLIWRGDDCRVVMINDPDLPGFCRVIWNRHVPEMTDLTVGGREHLMTLVFAVEEAMRHVMHPDKINMASLGNMVPHIHWHVIPRFKDDAFFPGTAWSNQTQVTPAPILAIRNQKAAELKEAIKAEIASLA